MELSVRLVQPVRKLFWALLREPLVMREVLWAAVLITCPKTISASIAILSMVLICLFLLPSTSLLT